MHRHLCDNLYLGPCAFFHVRLAVVRRGISLVFGLVKRKSSLFSLLFGAFLNHNRPVPLTTNCLLKFIHVQSSTFQMVLSGWSSDVELPKRQNRSVSFTADTMTIESITIFLAQRSKLNGLHLDTKSNEAELYRKPKDTFGRTKLISWLDLQLSSIVHQKDANPKRKPTGSPFTFWIGGFAEQVKTGDLSPDDIIIACVTSRSYFTCSY